MDYSELYNITQLYNITLNITNLLAEFGLPDIPEIQKFGSTTIISICLLCITLTYLGHLVYTLVSKKSNKNVKDKDKYPATEEAEYSWNQISDDSIESNTDTVELSEEEDIVEEMHYAAARLNQKCYEERCIALVKKCPEAINYPLPPLMFTPFLRACWWSNTRVVEMMLRHGADVSSYTKDGDSPMYLAVYRATKMPRAFDPACVNALYNAGCDINLPKFHGYTPLHLAAKAGNASLVRWLLVHGADPDSLCNGNRKPVDIANLNGHRKVVSLLTVRTGDDRRHRSPARRK